MGVDEMHEGAMKNHLSTKITAKQHAGEFKEDLYADGDLLFFFLHLLSVSIRPETSANID